MSDLISRKAAIDALRTCYDTEAITYTNGNEYISYDQALDLIDEIPSAQPETHEKRTETHACDYISRQAAIDIAKDLLIQMEEYHQYNQAVNNYCAELVKLPSAQPTIEPNHIEYTESEMKILELMFHIINETIKMQNGYMEIDYVSFDRGDLYNLAKKLGVEDY